jgi:hypothetical protein
MPSHHRLRRLLILLLALCAAGAAVLYLSRALVDL